MFQGVLPVRVISQMVAVGAVQDWREVYCCCSGTFRFERAVIKAAPLAVVRSNDVSMFSVAVGTYLAGGSFPIKWKGALEFVAQHVAPDDFEANAAAVVIGMEMAGFGIGRVSRYKSEHLKHFERTFADRLATSKANLRQLAVQAPIHAFDARDWLAHVDEAIGKGPDVGIAAFPPFFKGGYERMFKFLDENVEWDAPRYEVYDPKDLAGIVQRIHAAGNPYCIIADQLIPDVPLASEYLPRTGRPHYVYARSGRSSVLHGGFTVAPFVYEPIKPEKLSRESVLRVTPCEAAQANYVRECYIARNITPVPGMANYLVTLDDALLGTLVYSRGTMPGVFGLDAIYLLADVCTSREGKLSKLLCRLALSRQILDPLSARYVTRFNRVVTTAFSKHPASMKYRGSYEVHNRRRSDDGTGFVINYVGKALSDGPEEIWRWYWERHGAQLSAAGGVGETAD